MADATDYLLHAALGVLSGGEKAYTRKRDVEDTEALSQRKIQMEEESKLRILEKTPREVWNPKTQTFETRYGGAITQLKAEKEAAPTFFYKNTDKGIMFYDASGQKATEISDNAKFKSLQPTMEEKIGLEKYKADLVGKKEEKKVDVKKKAMQSKARKSITGTLNGLSEIESKINRLLSDPKLGSGTGWQSYILRQPAGKVKEIENLVDSIKAGISLDSLTELRANSPTGGALGNISDAEGQRLENKRAKLDPKAGDKIFKDALFDLKNSINKSKNLLKSGYEIDFDEPFEEESMTESSNPGITVDDFIKKNPGSKFLEYEQ